MDGVFCTMLFVIISLHGGHSAQWSAAFPEGAIVEACAGDANAIFTWAITLASGEEISDIHWFYHDDSEELIATFIHGIFFTMPTFSQRVQQKNGLGLALNHVTEGDAGSYSVEVIIRNRLSGATSTLRHTAVLKVYSQSKDTADVTVSVIQETEVAWDNSTGQYHVTLSCLYHGRQPSAVTWTLPSGASQVVWTSEGGKFSLLVPNPVSGGNYTCSVHPHTPANRCLRGDTLYLDRMEARLTLLEAEQQVLKVNDNTLETDNSQLKTETSQLKTENSQQTSSIQSLQTAITHLQTENIQQVSSIQTLQTTITHLQTENSQQTSSIQTLQTEINQQASSIQSLRIETTLLQTENLRQATSIGNLQAQNQQLHEMAIKRVAFHARIPDISPYYIQLHGGDRLVLTDVMYNQGNGYNSSTGVFTAPHSGTYTFLATLVPYGPSARADVYMRVDGTQVSWCLPYNTGESLACDAVLHLNAGQRVWAESYQEGYFSRYGTAFSGFLVSPDP